MLSSLLRTTERQHLHWPKRIKMKNTKENDVMLNPCLCWMLPCENIQLWMVLSRSVKHVSMQHFIRLRPYLLALSQNAIQDWYPCMDMMVPNDHRHRQHCSSNRFYGTILKIEREKYSVKCVRHWNRLFFFTFFLNGLGSTRGTEETYARWKKKRK